LLRVPAGNPCFDPISMTHPPTVKVLALKVLGDLQS